MAVAIKLFYTRNHKHLVAVGVPGVCLSLYYLGLIGVAIFSHA